MPLIVRSGHMLEKLKLMFSIDYRSLRLFRVMLGTGMVLNAIEMSLAAHYFYTDTGLYPRSIMFNNLVNSPHQFSSFFLNGSLWWALAHFAALGACGLAMIRGVRPRLVSFFGFILLNSIHNRVQDVLFGADDVINVATFLSVFLPPGKPKGEASNRFTDATSVAALLQLAVLYWATGFMKSADHWFWNPTAVRDALDSESYTTPLGYFLVHGMPDILMRLLTVSVWLWERVGWILFFMPVSFARFRIISAALFAFMHLAFGLTLSIGLFPLNCIAIICLLLPGEFWSWFAQFRVLKDFRLGGVEDRARWWTLAAQPVAAAFAAFIIFWNAGNVTMNPRLRVKRTGRWYARIVGLDQNWGMFSPYPSADRGWYFIEGTTKSGQLIDLLTMKPTTQYYGRPLFWIEKLPHYRFVSYLDSLYANKKIRLRERLIEYFCNEWDKNSDDKMDKIVVWMLREVPLSRVTIRDLAYENKCGAPPGSMTRAEK